MYVHATKKHSHGMTTHRLSVSLPLSHTHCSLTACWLIFDCSLPPSLFRCFQLISRERSFPPSSRRVSFPPSLRRAWPCPHAVSTLSQPDAAPCAAAAVATPPNSLIWWCCWSQEPGNARRQSSLTSLCIVEAQAEYIAAVSSSVSCSFVTMMSTPSSGLVPHSLSLATNSDELLSQAVSVNPLRESPAKTNSGTPKHSPASRADTNAPEREPSDRRSTKWPLATYTKLCEPADGGGGMAKTSPGRT